MYARRIFFQTIAEIYESDIAEVDKAILHYEKAADYFRVRAWLSSVLIWYMLFDFITWIPYNKDVIQMSSKNGFVWNSDLNYTVNVWIPG